MTAAPTPDAPEALGPLRAPTEEELEAADAELRDHALTLSWAANRLDIQPGRLAALVRTGEVLAVPGPWRVRQAHGRLGAYVPAWQLAPGPRPETLALIRAAADVGWTSLRLQRFMTTPVAATGETPARLLDEAGVEPVLALIRGEQLTRPEPAPQHRRERRLLRRPHTRRPSGRLHLR